MHMTQLPCTTSVLLLLAFQPVPLRAQTPRPEAVGLRPDAPTYAKRGPYWVGTRDVVIKDAADGISLPATFWYPALNPTGQKAAITYALDTRQTSQAGVGLVTTLKGQALTNAEPDPAGKPYPLVVFSPQAEDSRLMYAPLLEHLASHGFVVLGVDHVPDVFARRAKDLMRTIDFADKGGTLPGLIDLQQVALIGHGAGAKVAMNLGRVNFSRAGADPFDPRVKAIVPIAMGETTMFMKAEEAKLPMLFLAGSKDKYRSTADMEEIYQAMPAPRKALAVLKDCGHTTYLDPALASVMPKRDWGTQDGYRALDLVNHLTTAFLLDIFKGDKDAHKALLPEAVKFEEVQYLTTWK